MIPRYGLWDTQPQTLISTILPVQSNKTLKFIFHNAQTRGTGRRRKEVKKRKEIEHGLSKKQKKNEDEPHETAGNEKKNCRYEKKQKYAELSRRKEKSYEKGWEDYKTKI
jgi:hypothetical protein